MRLYQLNHKEFLELKNSPHKNFLLVESQVFGQQSEFLYHIACSNELAIWLTTQELGRKIQDKGRTIGFWQNLGGKGIYKKTQSGAAMIFAPKLVAVLQKCKEAEVRFEAPTWEEIIETMPLSDLIKSLLDVGTEKESTEEVSTTRRKKVKKSDKKYGEYLEAGREPYEKAAEFFAKKPTPLSAQDKQQYKKVAGYLGDIYIAKKNKAKGKPADQAKFADEEKKWNDLYDTISSMK